MRKILRQKFNTFIERFIWDIKKEEPKALGHRRVAKRGIIIGRYPDKLVLTHPILYELVGMVVPVFQDENGYFLIHDEERVTLHEESAKEPKFNSAIELFRDDPEKWKSIDACAFHPRRH